MYVGTYDSSGKLETRHGCRQRPPKDLCHPVDLCGGDDQRGKETHHAAMAPAQLQDQPTLEAFTLHQRRQLPMDRRVALDVGRALAAAVDSL